MTFPFKIPQLGEGLVGARVVTLWKRTGEFVERDEPLLEIETDKAIMSLESPVAGEVEEWLVKVEDDAEVGAVVCRIRTETTHKTVAPLQDAPQTGARLDTQEQTVAAPPSHAIRNGMVSPRGRALATAEGLSAAELERLNGDNGRVSLEDFQAHLQQSNDEVASIQPFTERSLSARQARLATYLERAWREVVPAILEIEVSWDGIENEVQARREANSTPDKPFKVTPLHVVAWAVCQSMREHPRFCSTWKSGGILREWRHVNIGFAVALEADELAVAVVSRAETMEFEGFSQATRREVAGIRAGEKSHGEAQFIISDLSRAGIISAVPLVVPPATAILFVGTPYDAAIRTPTDGLRWEKRARMVLTCDHRLVNGAGAAAFLRTFQRCLPVSPAASETV